MKTMSYIRHGQGKSDNAIFAESTGRFPLTRAIPIVAKELKITRKAARQLIEEAGPCEWHHTSKYGNATDYYDTEEIISDFKED